MTFRRGAHPKDYGGNAYGGKPYRNKPGSTLTYQCRDCRSIRHVSPREMNRAARPRCVNCGGPLLETDATAEKVLSDDSAENAKALNESMPCKNGHCRCWGCGLAFRKNYYLGAHLADSDTCREQYRIKGKLVVVGGAEYYAGTFAMLRDGDEILVTALNAGVNCFVTVGSFRRIYQAEEFVKPYTISLQASRIRQHWNAPKVEREKPAARCPVCGAGFVSEEYVMLHLAAADTCYSALDPGVLRDKVTKRRVEK